MNNGWSDGDKDQLKVANTRDGIKRRDILVSGGSLLAASALSEALVTATSIPANAQSTAAGLSPLPSDEIGEVATPTSTPIRSSLWK